MTRKIVSGVAVIESEEVVIKDTASAIDLMMSVKYETGCDTIALNKEAFIPEFFILSKQIAGGDSGEVYHLPDQAGNLRGFFQLHQQAAERFHL